MCGKCIKEGGLFMPWEKKQKKNCNVPKVAVAIDVITNKNDDDVITKEVTVETEATVNETKDSSNDNNSNDNNSK